MLLDVLLALLDLRVHGEAPRLVLLAPGIPAVVLEPDALVRGAVLALLYPVHARPAGFRYICESLVVL